MRWWASLWKRMWNALTEVPRKLRTRLSRRKSQLYKIEQVDDFPDTPKPLRVYLAGGTENFWGAAMLCPCGCGETIELNLLKQVRPCWSVHEDADGLVTLHPSVWRQKGCRSHFLLQHGVIRWC
jgi:hypothetical protein